MSTAMIVRKMNCWEYKKCGREQGGAKVGELGVCPSAIDMRVHGAFGGEKAGRACWLVAGSMCGGKIQGTFAQKPMNCVKCDFYKLVRREDHVTPTASYELSLRLKRERSAADDAVALRLGSASVA